MFSNELRIRSTEELTEGLQVIVVLEVAAARVDAIKEDGSAVVRTTDGTIYELDVGDVPTYPDLEDPATNVWWGRKAVWERLKAKPEDQQAPAAPATQPETPHQEQPQVIKVGQADDINLNDWVEEEL
jgi:hypothetical protein